MGMRPPIPPAAHPPTEPLAAVDRRLASVRRNEERRSQADHPSPPDTGRAEPEAGGTLVRVKWVA